MKLTKYDVWCEVHSTNLMVDDDADGEWVKASDAEAELQKLIDLFKNCRDSTGYSDEYFRGMYNGIEWARSCLENNEPQYKDSVEKPEPIYVPTCAEMAEGI